MIGNLRFVSILSLLFVLVCTVASSHALDVTLPYNMFEFEVTSDNSVAGDYYHVSMISTNSMDGAVHNAIITMDWQGKVVFYKQPTPEDYRLSVWTPFEEQNRYVHSIGNVNDADGAVILDTSYAVLDTIQRYNPHNTDLTLDCHEVYLHPDGTIYTIWREDRDVDMSQEVPGGRPDAVVGSHVIQQWDEYHNLLATWSGHEHENRLPYAAQIDSNALYQRWIEHLHVNSLDFFPDGDVLVSARNMSIIFRIDRQTGEVLWRMGGGPANDFTFTNSTGEEVPADFNWQHDARILSNGNITVFDNGQYHDPRASYAREYAVNYQTMTADLVWVHYVEDSYYSRIHGSVRRLEDGNTLIGWGSLYPDIHGQELNPDGEVVWQLEISNDMYNGNAPVRCYRILKAEEVGTAALPYVSKLKRGGNVELTCNWWGHEDEVAAYDIYWGQEPEPPYYATIDTGFVAIQYPPQGGLYYARIRALDANGNLISDWSNTVMTDLPTSAPEPGLTQPLPSTITLSPVWPNPFNSAARVAVTVGVPQQLELAVFNALGRRVATLYDGTLSPGQHAFSLNGNALGSGVFFVRAINQNGLINVQRMTRIK